jgi:hypothetical protein
MLCRENYLQQLTPTAVEHGSTATQYTESQALKAKEGGGKGDSYSIAADRTVSNVTSVLNQSL